MVRTAKRSDDNHRWQHIIFLPTFIKSSPRGESFIFNRTLPSMLINNPHQFRKVIDPVTTADVTLRDRNGVDVTDDLCHSILDDVFASSFSTSVSSSYIVLQVCNFLQMFSVIVDYEGVRIVMENLRTSTTADFNDISVMEEW
ncbi:MAG: hypothetical protein O7D30_08455 [Rickettsia endosymbiont of Ixodes persulcatus]|nr:hypothetical protein [Rickettsia endosymbiont of Ixodes persulcatus]